MPLAGASKLPAYLLLFISLLPPFVTPSICSTAFSRKFHTGLYSQITASHLSLASTLKSLTTLTLQALPLLPQPVFHPRERKASLHFSF